MSTPDWKTKYFDAVRTLEDDERRTREMEQGLRRIVTRLCIVGRGQDESLDEDLGALADANRRNAPVTDMTAIVARLRDVVAAVDQRTSLQKTLKPADAAVAVAEPAPPTAPPPAPQPAPAPIAASTPAAAALVDPNAMTARTAALRWAASCEAATLVLKQLARDEHTRDFADTMTSELRRADTDEALANILTRIADALQKRGDEIARDRLKANTLLTEMAARLDEVTDFLSNHSTSQQSAFGEADHLNSQVIQQVAHLKSEVQATDNIDRLRSVVGERLERIATQAREYRNRQESRFLEQSALAQKMTARVADLERQTSELHRSLHQEQKRARLDPLTGVPTRATFDERLADEIKRWQRFRSPVSVLVWDLDRFKSINDTYGHRAGDRVLKEVAKCFMTRLRTTDVLARFGGEEFVMLLIGTPQSEAQRVADELREAVGALPFQFRDTPVRVTASCGITELRDGDTPEIVFDRADAALYRAKDRGRNLCIAA